MWNAYIVRTRCRIAGMLVLAVCSTAGPAWAQIIPDPNTLYLIAGGTQGINEGTGAAAQFLRSYAVTKNIDGNLYLPDGDRIRKITPSGEVSNFAGMALNCGISDGVGSNARFCGPKGITSDMSGNLYVADWRNHTIRKVTPEGEVSTLAGSPRSAGSNNGIGSEARFDGPSSITIDSTGNLFVADLYNHTIRKITPAGEVSTIAGSARSMGHVDGVGSDARFTFPWGITSDASGNLYVTDQENFAIRKITPEGEVSTIAGRTGHIGNAEDAGSETRFGTLWGIASDAAGTLYVVDDYYNHSIRKVTPDGEVSTVVGSAEEGATEVDTLPSPLPGRINSPIGVALIDANQLVITTDVYQVLGANLVFPTVTFSSFTPSLALRSNRNVSQFKFDSAVALGTNGVAFNPAADAVSLQFGSVALIIPVNSFQLNADGEYVFEGSISNIRVAATIKPESSSTYRMKINGSTSDALNVTNPVSLTLDVGHNTGSANVTATIINTTTPTSPPVGGGRPRR